MARVERQKCSKQNQMSKKPSPQTAVAPVRSFQNVFAQHLVDSSTLRRTGVSELYHSVIDEATQTGRESQEEKFEDKK